MLSPSIYSFYSDTAVHHQSFAQPNQLFFGTLKSQLIHFQADSLEALAGFEYTAVFVDEAKNIKNYRTLAAKTLPKLQSNVIFCLTGTPIENRLLGPDGFMFPRVTGHAYGL